MSQTYYSVMKYDIKCVRRRPVIATALCLGLVLSMSGNGQTMDREVAKLEETYLAKRDELVRPHLNTYLEQLQQLRGTYASRRDMRLKAVEDEIQRAYRILTIRPLSLQGLNDTGQIPESDAEGAHQVSLLPARARLVGGAMYDSVATPAIHFSSLSQSAEWSLPALRPGRWQMRVTVACQPNAAATARVTLSGQAPMVVRIEPTGKDGELLTLNLGEIEFLTSPAALKVEMGENSGGSTRSRSMGRFSLAEVILTPLNQDL